MNLLQGTLDLLVLKALAGGPRHGYEVARWIHDATDTALEIEDGALYTALHRMEQRGWLKPEWGISEKGRRAKYYTLSAVGRRRLAAESREWSQYVAAVFKVLEMPENA